MPRERARRHAEALRRVRLAHAGRIDADVTALRQTSIARLIDQDAPLPPLAGNALVTAWDDMHEIITAMVTAIDAARHTVHAEFYILLLDATTRPFFDALERARRRGVRVRVLVDHLGSLRYPSFRATERRLGIASVQWRRMLPLSALRPEGRRPDLRNHRKLLVVDGNVAFLGSLNLIEPHYQRRVPRGLRWKDQWMRWEGPVVAAIEGVFFADWYAETGELLVPHRMPPPLSGETECQVIASGPPSQNESNLRLFTALIHRARRRVIMITPYFIPDDTLRFAITSAAKSGVEVQLLTSEVGDQLLPFHAQRSSYDELLRAGVQIFQHPRPTILHCKQLLIDDDVAVVGSSNLDVRSFRLSMEISLLITGSMPQPIRDLADRLRRLCIQLDPATWQDRPMRYRIAEQVARLASPLL